MPEAKYKISVASRVPAMSAAPTITELDELAPIGAITYADMLSGDGEASLQVEPDKIPSNIASRFKDLRATPCELNIYRDSVKTWVGTILSCQLQGPNLVINARGLLYYLRYMTLEADLIYASATDQYTIGAGLVDAYQDLDFGDYGIDTSGIGTHGTTRIRSYPFIENQNVHDRLLQLAEVKNGFDVHVDSATRDLTFSDPRGTDKTGSVYVDQSNIINPNVFWSVAGDDIASEAIAVGTPTDGPPVIGTKSNSTVRTTWGRATVFTTAENVTEQATVDDQAQRLLDGRQDQLLVPGPSSFSSEDVSPATFGPGDTISYAIDIGRIGQLYVERRIQTKRVTVDTAGVETLALEMV